MENKMQIPEELINICREMAEVAKKNNLISFSGSFMPTHRWSTNVSFSWEAGRHEEDSDEIKVSSQFNVFTRLTLPTNQ